MDQAERKDFGKPDEVREFPKGDRLHEGPMRKSVLTKAPVTTMLPVKNLDRAREFYVEKLGLEPEGLAADGKFLLRANDTLLALFPKPEGTKAEHTAVSFKVGDIAAAIRELESRGVAFDDYDLPGFKTVEHVCVLGSEKAAWFHDPEGNILCLHEDLR